MHPTATFKNLSDGHDRLEVALKQRSEALKVLVEEEFDRFASVKGTTMGARRTVGHVLRSQASSTR